MNAIFSNLAPNPTPMQRLHWSLAERAGVNVWIKRLDLVHPQASGNKWYKLIGNLEAMRAQGCNKVLSFGGGFSNHLHALAMVGQTLNLTTVGVVRGHYQEQLTPTLTDCWAAGMQLEFVDRFQWRRRDEPEYQEYLRQKYHFPWIVPEGGANDQGFEGCRLLAREIITELTQLTDQPVQVFSACGTGTTVAGLVAEMPSIYSVHGISVLKGADQLTEKIQAQLNRAQSDIRCQWCVDTRWHCGGYAKYPPFIAKFVKEFEQEHGFLLDPVYTAKVLFAVAQLLETNCFKKDENVLILHTGGLQGRRGFPELAS